MPNFNYPIDKYLEIEQKNREIEQANDPMSALGKGLGQGLTNYMDIKGQQAQQEQKQMGDLSANRSKVFNEYIKDKPLINAETGQVADLNDIMTAHDSFVSGQPLPAKYRFAQSSRGFNIPSKQESDQMLTDKGYSTNEYYVQGFDQSGNPMIRYKEPFGQSLDKKVMEKTALVMAGRRAEQDVKKESFEKTLDDFLVINDQIPRGKGWGRFLEGARSQGEGFVQESQRGQAVASYDSLIKGLRVQLVRAMGDVGNISVVEQSAAEKLVPTLYDSQEVAEIKTTFLKQFSKALKERNPEAMRNVLSMAGVPYKDNQTNPAQQTNNVDVRNLKVGQQFNGAKIKNIKRVR